MPALAIADELRADGAEVVFIGGGRAEAELVPGAGYELRALRVRGLSRTNPLEAVGAAIGAVGVVLGAWRMLRELRPDAVLGAGGYVAGVVGAAAVLLRIPLVLTESDSHLGLSNRLLARWSKCVCLAFDVPGRRAPRFRVTGRPAPAPFEDRGAARRQFGLGEEERCVLVFGGSIGARSINQAAVQAFADAPYVVIHVSGRRDYESLKSSIEREGYRLFDYISPFGPALAAADLVVARAGGSVFEIAAHGRPSVLIPYPAAAGDHQSANARHFQQAGAAVVIRDADLTAVGLRAAVDELLGDEERLRQMGQAAHALARPAAARDIASELIRAAG